MYTPDERKPLTVPALAEAKRTGRRLAMLTAYDTGFARVFDDNGIDLLLVGDSLGMVVQGHDSTLPVTVDDIAYHTACVARGVSRALLVAESFPGVSYAGLRQEVLFWFWDQRAGLQQETQLSG